MENILQIESHNTGARMNVGNTNIRMIITEIVQ